jgi:predicted ATPase/DNA-binding SARP family transcriptional activator
MLEIRLLGRFEVSRDGKPVAITSRPAQSLFAYLILNAGTSHRREKLAGMLWPDSLEETARDNLRHALWRMRKALESASSTRFLHADDISIRFNESSDFWLDAAELEKLKEHASSDEMMTVLSDYQGELLPGFYDEWVVLEREHLNSIFEHHMARLMSLLQEEKRWLDILDWGERWIKLGQKPEPAYRALMTAHAAKGDMSKVAATDERCVKSLREMGVEPSEQTQSLYEKLKARKGTFETGPAVPVEEKRKEPPKTNLPIPLTSFIGREREIEEMKHLLSTTRLLTLTGTGGIGKTRLAIQAARDLITLYKDGIWWVELAPVFDNRLVPQVVAQVVGVRESAAQPIAALLKGFLREKQLLLILDNCEHLIAACAQLADDLLTQCAHLRILTTSREPLGITGETVLHVPTLSFPVLAHVSQLQNLQEFESIQLFAERAAAIRPKLALTQENMLAATQICRRLDGIPLAIELAAARTKVFTLEEIAARLDDRFTLLTQGSRTALPRHQTLRALVEWSHDLLSETERVLWRRLSVFIGGWTLEAAESVCSDDVLLQVQILELLSQLVDKSLVIVEEQSSTARYQMLETIRQYGQEKLESSGENSQLRLRHVAFFLQLAEKATARLLTVEQKKWFAALDAEYGNLRVALEWAMETDPVKALQLAGALGQYREVRGYVSEGRASIERALQQAHGAPKEVHAEALRWQAKFAARQGDYARAKAPLEESLELSRELGDKRGMAKSLHNSGMVSVLQGDYTAAKTSYEESLALLKETGDKREMAALTTSLGNVANYMGDYETARRYQEESVTLFRGLGDKFGLFIALNNLGIVLERQGDVSGARRYYEASIETAYELGEKNLVAYALIGLAHVHYLENDLVEASRRYRESLHVAQETGERRCIAYCLEGFAQIARRAGNTSRAAQLLGAAVSLRQAVGTPLNQAEQEELDQDVRILRNRLGEKTFESAYATGAAMTAEQAIEFAIQEAKP